VSIDYQDIANQYEIKVHKVEKGDKYCEANGEDLYINSSFAAGKDEIFIGIYEDKDMEIASFFHELGHCMSNNLKQFKREELSKWDIELDAWVVGLNEAYKHNYSMKPSTFIYMVECLNSYVKYHK
jgi:hypothetical protein